MVLQGDAFLFSLYNRKCLYGLLSTMILPLFKHGQTGISQGPSSLPPEVYDSGIVPGISHSKSVAGGLRLPKVLRSVRHPLKNTGTVFVPRLPTPNLSHIRHHHAPFSHPHPRVVLGRLSGCDPHPWNQRRPDPEATGQFQQY